MPLRNRLGSRTFLNEGETINSIKGQESKKIIQNVVEGIVFLIYESISAGGNYFGNNQIIWAKFNINELNEEFPMLYESFKITTVTIEASNYNNSVHFPVGY